MCSIIGAVLWNTTARQSQSYNRVLNEICARSMERGRDGRGWHVQTVLEDNTKETISGRDTECSGDWGRTTFFGRPILKAGMVGNMRAEPTTEYVQDKAKGDQQPYSIGPWTIVHNGTIANDKELRTHELGTAIDSAAIVELLASDHMHSRTESEVIAHFGRCIDKLKGSFAILAMHSEHPGTMMIACNYRPIWFVRYPDAFFFASSRHYLPDDGSPQMIEPYTTWALMTDGELHELRRQKPSNDKRKALVVCSGGLDSVVAATYAQRNGFEIELLHFQYGSRAEGPEVRAVKDVAQALGVPLRLFPLPIYDPKDSPLLQADSAIAGGEAGAEFAHEWVPARNLVMLSIATALAEAGGFGTIILGNNLEEAGAYPDNEPEFIERFNDLLPFAVADGKRVRVIMPVGNMMKHEIVAMGHRIAAPLDKTWSCYRAGPVHCGTCGPCFMRRTAFEINGLPEVIPYANHKE